MGHDSTTLGRALGLSRQTIDYWLDGSYLPTATKYELLAQSLSVDEAIVRRAVVADRAARASAQPAPGATP